MGYFNSGAVTVYPSGTLEFTPVLCGVQFAQYLVSFVVFCRSLFGL